MSRRDAEDSQISVPKYDHRVVMGVVQLFRMTKTTSFLHIFSVSFSTIIKNDYVMSRTISKLSMNDRTVCLILSKNQSYDLNSIIIDKYWCRPMKTNISTLHF